MTPEQAKAKKAKERRDKHHIKRDALTEGEKTLQVSFVFVHVNRVLHKNKI